MVSIKYLENISDIYEYRTGVMPITYTGSPWTAFNVEGTGLKSAMYLRNFDNVMPSLSSIKLFDAKYAQYRFQYNVLDIVGNPPYTRDTATQVGFVFIDPTNGGYLESYVLETYSEISTSNNYAYLVNYYNANGSAIEAANLGDTRIITMASTFRPFVTLEIKVCIWKNLDDTIKYTVTMNYINKATGLIELTKVFPVKTLNSYTYISSARGFVHFENLTTTTTSVKALEFKELIC